MPIDDQRDVLVHRLAPDSFVLKRVIESDEICVEASTRASGSLLGCSRQHKNKMRRKDNQMPLEAPAQSTEHFQEGFLPRYYGNILPVCVRVCARARE